MLSKISKHHNFMWRYSKQLSRGLARPALVFLFFTTFTLIFGISAALYHLDPQAHLGVSSFIDVLYYVVTTMTGVGYGDVVPLTPLAKIISMLMMLLGTALFASYTAVLATIIMETEVKLEE